jgi:hypothetical protein
MTEHAQLTEDLIFLLFLDHGMKNCTFLLTARDYAPSPFRDHTKHGPFFLGSCRVENRSKCKSEV